MTSRVIDTARVSTALDLVDLLDTLKITLREMGVDTDLDTVYLGTDLQVSVIQNTLSDGSVTLDLRVVPVDSE